MAFSHRFLMAALLAAHAVTITSAVALSDFVPSIINLRSPCSTIYNQVIEGCVAQDFDVSKQRCSAACVSGLVEISQAVNRACSIDDVSETSIIGVFLQGRGIPILCPGVSVTTIRSSTATTTSTSTTSTAATSTVDDTPSRTPTLQTKGATSSSTLATSIANPQTSTSTQAAPTSSAAPQPSFSWSLFSSSSAAPEQSASPEQTASSQRSNVDSGGGSPFDVIATGSSSRPQKLSTSVVSAILGLAMLACVLI